MRAHESAQQDEGPEGSWVHAYLHRKEGDQDNAAYWYGRAGKPVCREPLDAEWLSIVRRFATQERCVCIIGCDDDADITVGGRSAVPLVHPRRMLPTPLC